MPRKFSPPFSHRRLAYIQPLTMLPHRFNDDVHMRMRFVGMQDKCVSVLQRELLASEISRGLQNPARRRPRRHRKHEFVNELGGCSTTRSREVGLTSLLF